MQRQGRGWRFLQMNNNNDTILRVVGANDLRRQCAGKKNDTILIFGIINLIVNNSIIL